MYRRAMMRRASMEYLWTLCNQRRNFLFLRLCTDTTATASPAHPLYNTAHRNQLLFSLVGAGLLPHTSRTTVLNTSSTFSPLSALVSTYFAPYLSATLRASSTDTCRLLSSAFCARARY